MKLYILDAGRITTPDRGNNTPGCGEGEPLTFPVPIYLIEHPDGLVLLDTGMEVDHWPEFMRRDAHVAPEQRADRLIASLGYAPRDIKYVIMSHLHLDHAGGMSYFPDAAFIVRRAELQQAWWPADRGPCGEGYVFADYSETRRFSYIELPDDEDYDVFGDGTVICTDTKGHTRGLQSVVVTLPDSGTVVLATDTIPLRENLELRIRAGRTLWNEELSLQAIDRMAAYRDSGALVVMGHDPGQWETLKKAPDFYS